VAIAVLDGGGRVCRPGGAGRGGGGGGGGGVFRRERPNFWCRKLRIFPNLWCVLTDKGGWAIADKGGGQFFAILCGRLLWTATYTEYLMYILFISKFLFCNHVGSEIYSAAKLFAS